MTTQEVKRKLVAIINADVKGYNCLMGEDEVGTIRTLNALAPKCKSSNCNRRDR